VEHEALGATHVEKGTPCFESEVVAKGRNHGLPKTWLIEKSAIPVPAVTIEKLPAELTRNGPVLFRFLSSALLYIAFRSRIIL
jgi:hypothetical protein